MKKTKLLMPLAGIAAIGTIAPIVTLSSCNKGEATTITGVDIYKTILGNETSTILTFSLNRELADGQTLKATGTELTAFTLSDPVVTGTVVTVKAEKTLLCEDNEIWTNDIVFECVNKDATVAWKATVKDCVISYSSVIYYAGESQIVATEEEDPTYKFEFELVSTPARNHTIKAFLVRNNYLSTTGVTGEVTVSTVGKKVTATVTLKKTNDLVMADHLGFDLEFYSIDDDNNIVWHSTMGTFVLGYTSAVKRLNGIDGSVTITDGVITAINYTGFQDDDAIMLDLTQDGFENVVGLDDNLFDLSATNVPSAANVVAIKFNKKCNQIGDACFKSSNIVYFDFSEMQQDAEWFQEGLFGEESFATASSYGIALLNPEWNEVYVHRFKQALFKAGLNINGWFEATEVRNITELRDALQYGGNIRVMDDITFDDGEEIPVTKSAILDLNGFTIEATEPITYVKETEQTAMFSIWNGAQLVVEDSSLLGTGTVKAPNVKITDTRIGNTYCFDVHTDNPSRYDQTSLYITGGNFYANRSVIHAHATIVDIDGGNFHLNKGCIEYWKNNSGTAKNGETYLLNCHDATYQAGNADFRVYGGRFYGWSFSGTLGENYFDPSDAKCENPREGETKVNFVQDGYKVVPHIATATEAGAEGYIEVVPEE